MHPKDWFKCSCGEPCMDGKPTCGRVECLCHVNLPKPQTRAGTLTTGEFINECGKAMGYPAPGSDASTEDGRFLSGPGYGGERM